MRNWKRKSQTIFATHKRWKITGNDQLLQSSYRLRWSAWRRTPGNQKCCAKSLKRSEERRVGKECRSQWARYGYKKKVGCEQGAGCGRREWRRGGVEGQDGRREE